MILMLMLFAAVMLFFIGSEVVSEGERRKSRIKREIINNARQIGMGLFEFELAYDRFPDASTIAEVKKQTGTSLVLTDASSNDLFRQLLPQKFVQSEKVFGAFEMNSKLPDGLFDSDANALTAGECGFAYVLASSSTNEPRWPLAFGPAKPGARSVDSELANGEVVVLFTDYTVKSFRMDPKGMIWIGENAFDPSHPDWNGKPLEIKWPK